MIKTGLEVLLSSHLDVLRDRRVGLVTHPAAVLPDLTHVMDALGGAGIKLVALFGPEHGFDASGEDGAAVEDAFDSRTGLPVYSLYGAFKEPTRSMLGDVDVLVFDIQDVGVRYYTFVSTLFYVLRSAAAAGVQVIVLDRPNPINGRTVSGPPIEPGFESFVGIASIPVRHGLTTGELALYFNKEFRLFADLTVIPMEGWQRWMWFDQTGLPWTPLSPGMPHLDTAVVYPGMCLIEGANLSEGRGTALPFQITGAPWMDGYRLAQELNLRKLPGVRFRQTNFVPFSSKHSGQTCFGVQVHVIDREAFDPLATGLHLIAVCRAQSPDHFIFLPSSWEGTKPHFDLLAGSAKLREALTAGAPVGEMVHDWLAYQASFEMIRQDFLLYR